MCLLGSPACGHYTTPIVLFVTQKSNLLPWSRGRQWWSTSMEGSGTLVSPFQHPFTHPWQNLVGLLISLVCTRAVVSTTCRKYKYGYINWIVFEDCMLFAFLSFLCQDASNEVWVDYIPAPFYTSCEIQCFGCE